MIYGSTLDFLFNLSNIYKKDYKEYLCFSYNSNDNDLISNHYVCYFNNDFNVNNGLITGNNTHKLEYVINDLSVNRYDSDLNLSINENQYLYYGNFNNLPNFDNVNRQLDLYFYVILLFLGLLVFIPFIKNLLLMKG